MCEHVLCVVLFTLTSMPMCMCMCDACAMQSDTSTTVSVTTTTSEWPSITKLPAKFSHKWKNRTSLLSTVVTQSSAPVTSHIAPKGMYSLCCCFFLANQ